MLTGRTNSYMGEFNCSGGFRADVQLQKSFAVRDMGSVATGGV